MRQQAGFLFAVGIRLEDETLRNIDSLKKTADFDRVYRKHRSLADENLVVYVAEGTGKIGIVCSKKIGNSIVRHHFARLVREAYRLNRSSIREDIDIIVIAREKAKDRGFTEIEASFLSLLKRHMIFKDMKN